MILDFLLSAMDRFPLSVGGGGSGVGPSRRPLPDLNFPPAPDPESARLEDELLRLRQDNAELSKTLKEENERLQAELELMEQALEKAKEQDCHRQERMEIFHQQRAEEYCRLKRREAFLKIENARLRSLLYGERK